MYMKIYYVLGRGLNYLDHMLWVTYTPCSESLIPHALSHLYPMLWVTYTHALSHLDPMLWVT